MAKRVLACLLCLGFCLGFAGCGSETSAQEEDTLSVVCTIFPLYDWARAIVGDTEGVEVTLLVQDGTDLHSYQPTVHDIAAITTADVFFYVGGESDTWVLDVMDLDAYAVPYSLALVEVANAVAEETVEGMQTETHTHDGEEEEEEEVDEHVWLSLRRACLACQSFADLLGAADPVHAETYAENCEAYTAQLEALDTQYTEIVAEAESPTILVADRFPFRYLVEEYDITYYAAFPGCSAESEASFETIAFLAEALTTLSSPCILITETGDTRLSDTIQESADITCPVLVLDSIQSVTEEELEAGATYLGRMEDNLAVLAEALGVEGDT